MTVGAVENATPRIYEWTPKQLAESTYACATRPRYVDFIRSGISPPLDLTTSRGLRTKVALARLDVQLTKTLPLRRASDVLLLATWNFNGLGDQNDLTGKRLAESDMYIAEILSHFDIVAVQEIRSREAFDRIMRYLGTDYGVRYGPVSLAHQGRGEYLAFVYDRRKIEPLSFASAIMVPRVARTRSDVRQLPKAWSTGQPARAPFLAEFQLRTEAESAVSERAVTRHLFSVANIHLCFCTDNRGLRTEEAEDTFPYLATEYGHQPLVVAGNFGSATANEPEFKILRDSGFMIDGESLVLATQVGGSQPYDQVGLFSPARAEQWRIGMTGVFDYFAYVFPVSEASLYKVDMPLVVPGGDVRGTEQRFTEWRTFQMSNKLPKWVQLVQVQGAAGS